MKSKKCSFSILGDSYSTFKAYIPEGYAAYYPNPEKVPDVLRVEDTWWHQLMQKKGMELLENNSYSGSTVCSFVRPGQKPFAPFVRRIEHALCAVSDGKPQPDYIVLFGATNDSWLERPVGQLQFADWTEADLEQVLPAYCYVLDHMRKENPQSQILCIINTDFAPELHAGMVHAAAHYGAVPVELTEIDKSCGHPTKQGMTQIADQIGAAMFEK